MIHRDSRLSINDQNLLATIEAERAKRKKQLKIDGKNLKTQVSSDSNNYCIYNHSSDDETDKEDEDDEFGYGNYKHYRKGSSVDDDDFSNDNAGFGRDTASPTGNYIANRFNANLYEHTIKLMKTPLNGQDEYMVLTIFLKDFKLERPVLHHELMNMLPDNIKVMAVGLINIKRIEIGLEVSGGEIGVTGSGFGQNVEGNAKSQLLEENVGIGGFGADGEMVQGKTVPRKILKIKGKKKIEGLY